MNTSQRTARIVGALFLISNITFLVGSFAFVESVLGAPDYLTLMAASRTQAVAGVLLELINGVAYVGIAVLMFPILKRAFESLALAYVGFRVIEFVMQALSGIAPLALLALSEELVSAGAPQSAALQTAGALLVAERYWAFQVLSLVFSLSALMFYYMLYRLQLIPRFLSVWGLTGAAFVLANTAFDMFGFNPGPALGLVLGLPMLLNELFLGVWLIIRGFNVSQDVQQPTQPDALTGPPALQPGA